ncbi:hypothetical protein [Streptomyces sp. NPDC056669]|uniref:hypothetical protein n=1 Tax=Streptomyces sp. NPDC056669 TaxID=3345903 RepID=UPI0036A4A7E3
MRLSDDMVATARDAAVATGLGHNRARQVFKELLADAVTDALQRNTGDILEQIDAEVAGLTSENLDLVAPGDLVRTLLTERRLGGTPRRHV